MSVKDFGRVTGGGGALALLNSLPDVYGARDLRALVKEIVRARRKRRPVAAAVGGHVVKCGTGPYLVDLIERGVVTGEAKTLHKGKIISSFVLGSKKTFDFLDNNPFVEFHPTEYVNDPFIIAKNEKMVAINSAIAVDITGQVCADSMGKNIYSGFGGQVDFIRGAARSKGGKPIIALRSTAKDGAISRIVDTLTEGSGVVTTRADVHYVVTEYGVANLHGRSLRERAAALIDCAHPDFREGLRAAARERNLL